MRAARVDNPSPGAQAVLARLAVEHSSPARSRRGGDQPTALLLRGLLFFWAMILVDLVWLYRGHA